MVTKRELLSVKDHVESAAATLRRFDHDIINQIVDRDLTDAVTALDYLLSVAD